MPGSVANEFLVASAYRRRLNGAVKKGDSTDVVNGKRAIGGDSAGFLLGILQNFVGITIDCCNWGRNNVKRQENLVGSGVLFEAG